MWDAKIGLGKGFLIDVHDLFYQSFVFWERAWNLKVAY
jgi:hypothetical protein